MLMNGHCSHLKHFTLGRALTKLAVALHSDGDGNFAAFFVTFDVGSMVAFDDADGCDGDESLVNLSPTAVAAARTATACD